MDMAEPGSAEESFEAREMASAPPTAPDMQVAPDVQPTARLIRDGTARLEVRSLDVALDSVRARTEAVQGIVARSEVREGREGARTASLGLRIPAANFESFVDGLDDLGRVLSASTTTTDVSREYFDLEIRVAVLEETVQRLRDLLSRSGSIQDIVAVERELARVTSNLESLKGQIRFYDQRVAYSELSLMLEEPGAALAPGIFRPVATAFRNSLRVFGESLGTLVSVAAFVVPWLILLALLWPVGRWARNRLRRRRTVNRPSSS